jgi:hypothetical protein
MEIISGIVSVPRTSLSRVYGSLEEEIVFKYSE